jgi:hypothetical protein
MPLIPTTELWRATIEGAPHLERTFPMPIGATWGQAAYVICEVWSHARCASWRVDAKAPSRFLRLECVAACMVEVAELDRAA